MSGAAGHDDSLTWSQWIRPAGRQLVMNGLTCSHESNQESRDGTENRYEWSEPHG
jgi:redox-sensitive bicupin YhaK (pirin superfamily)